MSRMIDDVPILNQAQFTGLQMAISMSGNNYSISTLGQLNEREADGWHPIALSDSGEVLYLSNPEDISEEETEE